MLRPLCKTDLEMILKWRNQPNVRSSMFNKHLISLKEHFAWFDSIKSDPRKAWFIFGSNSEVPQGVVYFYDINHKHGSAHWGLYKDNAAPPGTGVLMAIESIDEAFYKIGLKIIIAKVLSSNLHSIKFHIKIGFTMKKKYSNFAIYELNASQWIILRERLLGIA